MALLFLLDILIGFRWWFTKRENRFDSAVIAASRRYQIDPALVKAVVWRESRFDPAAEGKAGELGLMQIRELAASEWAEAENIDGFQHDQLRDPTLNTLAGSWYLAKLLRRYSDTDNPIPYALADYNAGRTHVLRWNHGTGATNSNRFLDQISFPGTRDYVEQVMKRHQHYRKSGLPEPTEESNP